MVGEHIDVTLVWLSAKQVVPGVLGLKLPTLGIPSHPSLLTMRTPWKAITPAAWGRY